MLHFPAGLQELSLSPGFLKMPRSLLLAGAEAHWIGFYLVSLGKGNFAAFATFFEYRASCAEAATDV